MRASLWLCLLLLFGCGPEGSSAEWTLGGAGEGGVIEVEHRAQVRLGPGEALLEVTRTFVNRGGEEDELVVDLQVPQGAVATDLRLHTRGLELQARLVDVALGWERFEELAAPGSGQGLPVAVLQWQHGDRLILKAFPVGEGEAIEVTYLLRAPTTWEEGRWRLEYPSAESGQAPAPRLEVDSPWGVEVEQEDEEDGKGPFRLSTPGPTIDLLEARWATRELPSGRTLWRLEVEAAAELQPAPRRPTVVFVVDASHSVGPEGIAAQLQLLPGYLAHLPDARVEVVVFRRRAQRLFGAFLPPVDALQRLSVLPDGALLSGNGSNVEEGARLAASLLRGIPEARVVLTGDQWFRTGLDAEGVLAALEGLPSDAVVHSVRRTASEGDWEESLDEALFLAPVAARFGGTSLAVVGGDDDPEAQRRTLLHLVRPLRLDHVQVEAPGLEAELEARLEDSLNGGDSFRQMDASPEVPSAVTFRARLWGKEVVRVVPFSPELFERLPARAVGEPLWLEDQDLRELAMAAHLVSDATSLLVDPPGAGPRGAVGALALFGYGHGRSWSCGGRGSGGRRGGAAGPDLQVLMEAVVARLWTGCAGGLGPQEAPASVAVEVTGREIVDLVVETSWPKLASCLEEALWAEPLPSVFGWAGQRTFLVATGR